MSLLRVLRVRVSQGTPYIRDLRAARPVGLRGLPVIAAKSCKQGCSACRDTCPTQAVTLNPVAIDLGRCVFCDACTEVCPEQKLAFTADPRLASDDRTRLSVREAESAQLAVRASATFTRIFGRSLKLRQVSAGGCNACELELNAVANVNFDLQRFGVEWVASPRHADALVLTGPLTRNMRDAVRLAWDAMADPRFVVAVGACAISGGLYANADGVERSFLEEVGPAIYVPGCPPHPLTFVHGILDLIGA